MEKKLLPLFKGYNYATTTYSPLEGGMLTGKYVDNVPEDSRMAVDFWKQFYYHPYMNENSKEKTIKMLKGLKAISKELDCSMAVLSLAWCLKFRGVTSLIIGASRPSQLE